MTDKKTLLKRKLCDVIDRATNLSVLDEPDRKAHIDNLERLLKTVDVELDAIEKHVTDREAQLTEELKMKLQGVINRMTTEKFPQMAEKVRGLEYSFECSGLLWTEGITDACYSRDHNGHCDNSDHVDNYQDKLQIRVNETKEVIYDHSVDCGVLEMDHGDDKVHISVDLPKSMDFMIDYACDSITPSESDFLKWVCEVHQIFYSELGEQTTRLGHRYTDELKRLLFGTRGETDGKEKATQKKQKTEE